MHTAKALKVTSFRPSVIFGPGDSFLNRFAGLLRLTPGVFPLACPRARFQPVYVEDVVRAFVESLGNHKTFGQRYDLCGPKVYTLREIVEYVARLIGRRVRILGLNDRLSRLRAAMEFAPGAVSLDNYHSLQVDSVCQGEFPPVSASRPRRSRTSCRLTSAGGRPSATVSYVPKWERAKDKNLTYSPFQPDPFPASLRGNIRSLYR